MEEYIQFMTQESLTVAWRHNWAKSALRLLISIVIHWTSPVD